MSKWITYFWLATLESGIKERWYSYADGYVSMDMYVKIYEC